MKKINSEKRILVFLNLLFLYSYFNEKEFFMAIKSTGKNKTAGTASVEEFRRRCEKLELRREDIAKIFGVKPETIDGWLEGKAVAGPNALETLNALEQLCEKPEGRIIIDRICAMDPNECDIETILAEGTETLDNDTSAGEGSKKGFFRSLMDKFLGDKAYKN
jgi:transcriptional regulator with XRE-family HTH domain